MTRQKAWSEVEVSAYLDGALDAPTRQAFEAAVARDDNLHRQVDDLRAVVALVRMAPLREPPRNYLLTTGMVAETPPKRAVQRRPPLLWMRLATSLTAAAFVVTAGLSFLSRGISPAMVTQDSAEFGAQIAVTVEVEKAAEGLALEAATEEKLVEQPPAPQQEMEFAPLKASEGSADGLGGGSLAPEPALMAAEVISPTLEAAKAEGDVGKTSPDEQPLRMFSPESVTETVAAGEGMLVDAAPMLATGEDGAETSTTMAQPLAYADDRASDEAQRSVRFPALWLPGVLGIATLILAGVTLWMSRRR